MPCGKETPFGRQPGELADQVLNDPRVQPPHVFAGYNTTLVHRSCLDPVDFLAVADVVSSENYHDAPRGTSAHTKFYSNINSQPANPIIALTSWCDACVHVASNTIISTTSLSIAEQNLAAMHWFDWAVLVFSTVVVGLAVVSELRDILLCSYAMRDAVARPRNSPRALRFLVSATSFARRHIFLPVLVIIPCFLCTMRCAATG